MSKQKKHETFAQRLVRLREAAGLTKYALAKKSGLTSQGLGKLEMGAEPTWNTVRLLALALGVPLTEFDTGELQLPEVKPPTPPGRRRKQE